MAEGYFNDGTVDVQLGRHVFATPGLKRRNLVLGQHRGNASILDSGGGILSLDVRGQRMRANLGDAERYIYELLRALAFSGPGDLGCEDNRGHRHVFGDAVCVGGTGEVQGHRFADVTFDFLCPEKSSEPAWGAVPAAPGKYPGTSTHQNYAVGGVPLGVAGNMTIQMTRQYRLREVPRARGARVTIPRSGARMELRIEAALIADTAHLATEIENLERSIGPGPVNLTANGVTYTGVILDTIKPRHVDVKATTLTFRFLQQL